MRGWKAACKMLLHAGVSKAAFELRYITQVTEPHSLKAYAHVGLLSEERRRLVLSRKFHQWAAVLRPQDLMYMKQHLEQRELQQA